MRHAVIMAGGAGVRLWPLSTHDRPKQILRLFGGTSLLRQSYERARTLVPADKIYVITNRLHLPLVRQDIPELPEANLFGEPVGRDTAAAVGLAAAVIAQRDPDAIIGMFTADHMITPIERFTRSVEQAYEVAEGDPEALVTLGIRPNRPDTQYGYIHRGEQLPSGAYAARKFTEKPSLASAIKYIGSGEYYWNSGMFAWRAKTILQQLATHLPQTEETVRRIATAWDTPQRDEQLGRLYPGLLKISIDFAVMERAQRVLVVEMDCHWVDVGSWPSMEAVIEADSEGNISTGPTVVHLGSRGNIVVSLDDHLIATIGVDDLVIVHAPQATLICTKRDANSIKELVDKVRTRHGETYT
jgi:mannose-1-phosphate guanylyltransferase